MDWADELAARVEGPQVVNDSKTPSGTVHVGSLRGPVILDVITRALRTRGLEAQLLYGVDDMDPMDAQALLSPDAIEREMGRPLAHVPDPAGDCHASYARHFAGIFIDTFAGLGIHPDRYYWMSDIYPTGRMDPFIRTALDRAAVVRDIYRRVANVQHPDHWLPLGVVCPSCGKIGTTIASDWDGETVAVACRTDLVEWATGCGWTGRIAPFGGAAKLPWNLEWAAQWSLFGVTIEPNGKDLATAGGSRDRSDAIAREVFEREPPINFPYEFLNIGGRKMSTSKGRGAAAHTIGSVLPPEQLRFLFVRNRPETAIEFDPEGSDAIPRLFDEFDRLAGATAGREVKGELPSGFESIFRYSLLDPAADIEAAADAYRPAFGHLALLVQVPGVDVAERVAAEKGSPLTAAETLELEQRLAAVRCVARCLRPGACPDRDPPRRRPGRGRAAAARAARVPARPRDRRHGRCARRRRAVAGRGVRRRRRPRPRRQGRVQRPLSRVPRPAQRAACRMAAGKPRARLRRRPAARGRHDRGGAGMSVGVQRLREEPDRIRQGAIDKREDPAIVDQALVVDATRRRLQAESDTLKAERNTASKQIGEAIRGGARPDGPEVADLRSASTRAGSRIEQIDAELAAAELELEDLLLRIPNPADPEVPVGGEEANVTVRTWGEPGPRRATATDGSEWERRPHWELGESLDIIDNVRGAKVAGSGFPVYKGAGSRLQRSLISWFLDVHTTENGFTEVWPPAVVNTASARGTGQIPDKEDQMYVVTRDDLYLVPTAEVPVTNLHRDEILEASDLPIRYAAYSPCFRREAGAAGKDTRGILRVHQFDKVEMVLFEKPDDSPAALEWMTGRAEDLLQRLGLAYRVLLMSTGDMGFVQRKKYDLEVWAPGVERWLEVSSCSNFGDYQARRMGIRYRPTPGAKPELVHTLNGSGLALARIVAAILEVYQNPDGTVTVPQVLRPYLGTDTIGTASAGT